ncbi:hypothetical protein EON77_18985, partial [bacterium]
MRDTPIRAVSLVVEALEARGVSAEPLLRDVSFTLADVRDLRGRIPWAEFIQVMTNLEELVGGLDQVAELGRTMVRFPSYLLLRDVSRIAVSPRLLHRMGFRFVAPLFFPHLQIGWTDLPDGRFVLDARVPESMPMVPAFYYVFAGTLAGVSTLVGDPFAEVDVELVGKRARITVALVRSKRSVVERLTRLARAARELPRVAIELDLHRS